MGLGLVRDRLGKTREALPILEQALEHYQKEHTKDFRQLGMFKTDAMEGRRMNILRVSCSYHTPFETILGQGAPA